MNKKLKPASRRATPWDEKSGLSPTEAFIKSNYLDSFNVRHSKLSDTNEGEFINSFKITQCKYCSSTQIQKKGFTKNGVQRYRCLDCHKSFNALTNTIFDNHKVPIKEWIQFCLNLFSFESVSVTSKNNKNSITTSQYWLYKLFLMLKGYQNGIILSGNVQIDETFYKVKKQDIVMADNKELRGLSRNQFCIGIGCDENYTYAMIEGMGKTSRIKTITTFKNHIKPKSILIHDKEKSHNDLVDLLELESITYDSNEIKKLEDKANPLYEINHKCFLLKKFLNSHSGFNRENLQDYLNLFTLMMNPPINKLEKVKLLLSSAINGAENLTYREFLAKKV
jgi:transposase-like protein